MLDLLPVSDKVVLRAQKLKAKVKPEFIIDNSNSITVIVPRQQDPDTFRTPRINKETGEYMCSCERWLMFSAFCSHMVVVLLILQDKYGTEFSNNLIMKIADRMTSLKDEYETEYV